MLLLISRRAALVSEHPEYYHLQTLCQALQTLIAEGNEGGAARIRREIEARAPLQFAA
jgi:hypothetical protein